MTLGAAVAGFAIGGGLFGGNIAEAIKNPAKTDFTVYLESKKADGTVTPVVLSVGKEQSLGNRIALAGFAAAPEKAETMDLGARHLVKGKAEHPIPEPRTDKALIFKSILMWHSRELVMREVDGLFWADWQVPQS